MEITKEYLEARRQELLNAIEEIKGNLNANYGALQQVDKDLERLAQAAPVMPKSK